MLKDKRGLIGKIFLVLGIVVLVLGIIIGVTAYQAYDLINTAKEEQTNMKNEIAGLQTGNCSKITSIETSLNQIVKKAKSACKNPLINYAVNKIKDMPIKCQNVTSLENQMQIGLAPVKAACANQTI